MPATEWPGVLLHKTYIKKKLDLHSMSRTKVRSLRKSVQLTHRFYKITGGYRFLKDGFYKLGLGLLAFGAAIWALNNYLIDLESVTDWITIHLHWGILVVLLGLSETVTGLLPPDFFILWAHGFQYPWLMVLLLATVSYLGGLISYFIGQRLHRLPRIKNLIDVRFESHFAQIKRFGGLLIFLAAMTPLPFAPVCTVAGMVHFRYRWFLWVSATRFLRFFLYAYFIFELI